MGVLNGILMFFAIKKIENTYKNLYDAFPAALILVMFVTGNTILAFFFFIY